MVLGNFLKAFAQLLHVAIQVYIFIIIARAIISWMGNIPPGTLVYILRRLTDPVFRFVHRTLPFTIIGGIDISPIIIVTVLYFVDNFIYGTLLGYAHRLIVSGG